MYESTAISLPRAITPKPVLLEVILRLTQNTTCTTDFHLLQGDTGEFAMLFRLHGLQQILLDKNEYRLLYNK